MQQQHIKDHNFENIGVICKQSKTITSATKICVKTKHCSSTPNSIYIDKHLALKGNLDTNWCWTILTHFPSSNRKKIRDNRRLDDAS